MSRFAEYAGTGNTFKKAVDAVLSGDVKRHVFTSSGRIICTVVGSNGDEFIDPEKPYCSCSNFFFRVMSGKVEYCYHLLGYRIALEARRIDQVTFSDEEYIQFFRAVAADVLHNLGRRRHVTK
jgi:predicted nucleic acid-binding Zn finger protein